MKCREVLDKLSEYVAEELAAGAQDEVAAHLQACEGCRMEAEAFRRAEEALNALGAVEAPPGPTEDLGRRIAAPEARRLGWIWAGAAGTAVAAVAIAVLVWTKPGGLERPELVRVEEAAPQVAAVHVTPPPSPVPSLKPPDVRPAVVRDGRSIAHQVASPPDQRLEVRRAEAAQPEQAEAGVEASPAGTDEGSGGVILPLGRPEPILPSSSYYAEITFPDGAKSILNQSVERDAAGQPRVVQISYQQIASQAENVNEGG